MYWPLSRGVAVGVWRVPQPPQADRVVTVQDAGGRGHTEVTQVSQGRQTERAGDMR